MEFSPRLMEWLSFLWQVNFICKTITIPDFGREALFSWIKLLSTELNTSTARGLFPPYIQATISAF